MCQHIIQFCTGSAKPLLYAGGFLTFVSAVSLGYIGCTTHGLYQDIDIKVADSKSLSYYLQLLAAVYLILLTALTCFAAHYDQKHSIRALATLTSVNFILTVVAILLLQNGRVEIESLFGARLKQAQSLYDRKDKFTGLLNQTAPSSTPDENKLRPARMAFSYESSDNGGETPLNATEATRIWDNLQARGCCGYQNYTTEWKDRLPKSCCDKPVEAANGEQQCKDADSAHQKSCSSIISSLDRYLLVVLALIALVNLYLATVTGVSTYRTFNYNEASQSAYT